MLVHDFLGRAAQHAPDSIGVIDQTAAFTYGALDNRADRVAGALKRHGVKHGDRVLVALENSVDWIACYFGVLKAGAIAVPVASGSKNDRLPHVVRDCTPTACIVDGVTLQALPQTLAATATMFVRQGRASDVKAQLGNPIIELEVAIHESSGLSGHEASSSTDQDLAAIVYTSGSTGTPRGVMLSHRNICANTQSIVEYLKMTAADRMMVILPFHYVYGLSLLHTHFSVGGSLVLDNRFAFPNVVLQAMQTHAVTSLAGVPSTFAILLRRSAMHRMRFPTLRYVTQAGGAMPQALVREWQQVMPEVPLIVMYGATEASARLAYLEPVELSKRPGSIGRPIPDVELHVITEDGAVARPGEVGELVARGANIMLGYWNRPRESRDAFGPWGYRTGDLATTDTDGFLYLVGRKQDMLKVGAHRVGAAEIEEVLHEHHAVHQAAVIAVPDEILGEVPVAFTTPRNDVTIVPEDLILFCRERLPDYKVPSRIIVIDDLPRTEAGKIDKSLLRQAASHLAEQRLTNG